MEAPHPITELRHALQAAHDQLRQLRLGCSAARDAELATRVAPLEEAVRRERQAIEAEMILRFSQLTREAEDTVHNAGQALDAALVAAAVSNTGWLPVGTKLCLWEVLRYPTQKRVKTTTRGVVEVWNADSLYQRRRYTTFTPLAGTVVVRVLKKDGKPSMKYIPVRSAWERDRWLPEGTTPQEVTA